MGNILFSLTQDKISLALNLTILLTNPYGIGLSNGNWTDPLPYLYIDNSRLNALAADGIFKQEIFLRIYYQE